MSDHTLCTTETSQPEVRQVQQSDRQRPTFRPQIDLLDTGDAITLWADLPGADENSVEITIENNVLTLKAAVQPPEFEGMKFVRREYRVGDYERRFTISDEIDRDKIEAVVTQGVLKLTLPKTTQAASRKITVKAG